MKLKVYIGVGSNIEPEANISRALDLLRARVNVTASSTFYWTAPIGRPGQARYLNGVWCVETDLHARDLKFTVLRDVEARLGRTRTRDKYSPRAIDLDVLLAADVAVAEPHCRIPAPEVRTRPFFAVALLELLPDAVLPDTGEKLAELDVVKTAAGLEPAAQFTQRLRRRLREEA